MSTTKKRSATSAAKKTTKKRATKKPANRPRAKGDGDGLQRVWAGYKKPPLPIDLKGMPKPLPYITPHDGNSVFPSKIPEDVAAARKAAALVGMSVSGNIGGACYAAGVPRGVLMYWRKHDQEFADALDDAYRDAADSLEQEATRRARDGVTQKVFWKGVEIAEEIRHSDLLMSKLLAAHKPEEYRERREISGPGGGPIRSETTMEIGEETKHDVVDKLLALVSPKSDNPDND